MKKVGRNKQKMFRKVVYTEEKFLKILNKSFNNDPVG